MGTQRQRNYANERDTHDRRCGNALARTVHPDDSPLLFSQLQSDMAVTPLSTNSNSTRSNAHGRYPGLVIERGANGKPILRGLHASQNIPALSYEWVVALLDPNNTQSEVRARLNSNVILDVRMAGACEMLVAVALLLPNLRTLRGTLTDLHNCGHVIGVFKYAIVFPQSLWLQEYNLLHGSMRLIVRPQETTIGQNYLVDFSRLPIDLLTYPVLTELGHQLVHHLQNHSATLVGWERIWERLWDAFRHEPIPGWPNRPPTKPSGKELKALLQAWLRHITLFNWNPNDRMAVFTTQEFRAMLRFPVYELLTEW
jgi:hypothetical protein